MPPTKLAHLVFQTNRIGAMRDWYCTVLDGHVVYENPQLSFVTYDDEHHRVAFADFGPLSPRATDTELFIKPRAAGPPSRGLTFEAMDSSSTTTSGLMNSSVSVARGLSGPKSAKATR